MQGPLKTVARYFTQTAQSVAADWNKFWYTPGQSVAARLDPDHDRAHAAFTPMRSGAWHCAISFSSTGWLSPALVRRIQENQYLTRSGTWCRMAGSGRPTPSRWWSSLSSPSASSPG